MKKRITSLFLAVLMAVSVISTSASAASADDGGIMPYGLKCPYCMVGNIRNVRVTSVPQRPKEVKRYDCGCSDYVTVYKEEWQDKCDNCTDFKADSVTKERPVNWTDNSNCRGNH